MSMTSRERAVHCLEHGTAANKTEIIRDLLAELDTLTRQRDVLAKAMKWISVGATCEDCYDNCLVCIEDKADQALKDAGIGG